LQSDSNAIAMPLQSDPIAIAVQLLSERKAIAKQLQSDYRVIAKLPNGTSLRLQSSAIPLFLTVRKFTHHSSQLTLI
jgi:hypothetical protein